MVELDDKILTVLENSSKKKCIDIGSGRGEVTVRLGEFFNSIAGIDPKGNFIETDNEKVSFIKNDFFSNSFNESEFDFAFSRNVLHHIEKDRILSLFSEVNKITGSGAEFLVIEPINKSESFQQKNFLEFRNLIIEIDRESGKNHFPLLSQVTIANFLEKSGFKITKRILLQGKQGRDEKVTSTILKRIKDYYFPLLESKPEFHEKYYNRLISLYEKIESSGASEHHSILFFAENIKENKVKKTYKTIKEKPSEMPREKMKEGRIEEMELYELVSIILGMNTKTEDVFTLSKRIIREYGSRGLAEEKDPKKLMDILGIGEVQACKLVSAFELGRRFYSEKVKRRKLIRGPEDVYEYAKDMGTLVKENFRGLYLNAKNYVIHDEVISVGHLTSSLVHPREVFKSAFEYSAAALIVIHNHPSGDPSPSKDDDNVTKMLKESGDILGLPVLDHIIIGEDRYYSYNEDGK